MRHQILQFISAAALAVLVGWPAPALASWINPGPSDADLERVVRVAYSVAADFARQNVNYFARDGEFEPLQSAISTGLSTGGFAAVAVTALPVDKTADARKCGNAGAGIELRIASNSFGDSLSLAAVSSRRIFTYHYDPHEKAEIVVTPSQDCSKP